MLAKASGFVAVKLTALFLRGIFRPSDCFPRLGLPQEVDVSGCEPFDYPQPFVQQVTATPAAIDGLGHVNNAVYVQWCEQVAWAHSQALGLTLADYTQLDRAMAIRQARYDYLLPAIEGDQLTLATWLTASDARLNMTRQFQLLRNTVTLMRGHWQLVCIEMSSGRARRMPRAFLDTYEPALVLASQGDTGGEHE